MKAIMVMFDSLNRHFLPPYGNDWVHAPNFQRLAERTATFNTCYVGSLPCMPARRELHTGRLNFLHRGWSPLEPFDDSMPEILKFNGVHTHLVSDHDHYWEDGGASYHPRYTTWENVRGQEGDPWKGDMDPSIQCQTLVTPSKANNPFKNGRRLDAVNRRYLDTEEKSCQKQVFDLGLEFMETNKNYDNWFLQIESFDPHEPFFTYEEFLNLYDIPDIGREADWPPYDAVKQDEKTVEHVRKKYAALLSMCDKNLGRVLDFMDANEMWKDTMLIVCTDHGFCLGEHQCWAKNWMPVYEEIAHTPLFIWDPRCGAQNVRREALVQTIDIAPTLLRFFGVEPSKDVTGHDLAETVAKDTPVRDYALFGYLGAQMNVTDGRYVYMRSPRDMESPFYEYTLMPSRMAWRMSSKELENATLAPPFSFTKNMPTLRIPAATGYMFRAVEAGDMLYDLKEDPGELNPINDPATQDRLAEAMAQLMRAEDAPDELFVRFGL